MKNDTLDSQVKRPTISILARKATLRALNQRALDIVLTAAISLIRPFILFYNRVKAKKDWIIILGEVRYCRELNERANALGYKIMLFDPAPKSMDWRFASASKVCYFDSEKITDEIYSAANRLGCPVVLMQSINTLLPVYAEVNNRLENLITFSKTAIQASLDKRIMRDCLNQANIPLPMWKIIEDVRMFDGLPFPTVIKPRVGQGSRGVAYVESIIDAKKAKEIIFNCYDQHDCLYEEFLIGRQFNIDGVLVEGTPYFHMTTEECYSDYLPDFRPSWYLFGPLLAQEMENDILRETQPGLSACDFNSGAFHLELIFKRNHAYTIDVSNRMPSDFPKFARQVMGFDSIDDYINVMHGRQIRKSSLLSRNRKSSLLSRKGCQMLQYYNYPDNPFHSEIKRLAHHIESIGELKLSKDAFVYELTGDESRLRSFLHRVNELSN